MPHLRVLLGAAALVAVTACTDEGEGSVRGTGVGLFAIPWWLIILLVLAWSAVVWLRKRKRR